MTSVPDVSIDNLTLMGEFSDWPLSQEFINHLISGNHARPLPGVVIDSEVVQRRFLVGSAHLSVNVRPGALARSEHQVSVRDDRPLPVRLEFNPNRANGFIYELVRMMNVHRVSRCDVAIDYAGLDISDFHFHRDRVKSRVHRGRGVLGELETVYLGSPNSERCIRIYDKAKELGIREDLTRIEAVGRHRKVLSDDLFKGLTVWDRSISSELKTTDAALLALAVHYPDHLARADKRTRARVLDLMRDAACLDPAPEDLYMDRLSDLRVLVSAVCEDGFVLNPAAVYVDQMISSADSGSRPKKWPPEVAAPTAVH